MHSDPIADLLTRIRNGIISRAMNVDCPVSKIKLEVLRILKDEGFITGFEVITESKFPSVRVHLRYDDRRKPVIHSIMRVSKPGLRVYKGSGELRPIRSGLATRVMTTSQGVMTDREARRRKIGGEVLCEVW
ncbi:MAG: 30S ribosomal protein S8 [Fimbriimonadaceae bacterium]|nr:30S ribosomal protein S8 [Fimbriimonadaceae bacterium]QYK55904.1 MAG: 30S ribosomal protein S8 [Fimbriimonadaceae bacterium]